MMSNKIDPDEILYRSVNPFNWYVEEGRVRSSLFKNANGVSVDRDGKRPEEFIVNTFKERFGKENVKAVVHVYAQDCYDLPAKCIYKPEETNIYHSEIHDIDRVELTSSKARRLANKCIVIKCA